MSKHTLRERYHRALRPVCWLVGHDVIPGETDSLDIGIGMQTYQVTPDSCGRCWTWEREWGFLLDDYTPRGAAQYIWRWKIKAPIQEWLCVNWHNGHRYPNRSDIEPFVNFVRCERCARHMFIEGVEWQEEGDE